MSVISGPTRGTPVRFLLAGAWLTWLVCAALHGASGAPLGHDEARYAIAGRDLLAGDDARWIYVPPGMEVLAVPGVLLGGGERALRLVPVLLAIAFLAGLHRIARAVGDRDTAAWTVAFAAATGPLVRVASDLLSDVPSTALLLATAVIVVRELTREDGPTRTLLWSAVTGAGAFYIRYGSCIPLAIIAVLAVAGGARGIVRRPGLVGMTLALFLALLAPHLVHAQLTTGSLLGTLRVSATVPKGFGQGIATYAAHPVRYLGVFAVVLVPFAVVSGRRTRVRTLLLALAVLDLLSLGIQTTAQARYVFLATTLLLILGPPGVPRRLAPIAVVAVVIGWAVQIGFAVRYDHVRRAGTRTTMLAQAAIRRDATTPCYVLGRHDTQLEWYTGCRYVLVLPAVIDRALYAVWDATGGPWQPAIAALPEPRRELLRVPGQVEVVRVH